MMPNQAMQQEVQLYDIYGMWHVPFWQTTWFFIAMILLACFVFSAILFLLYTRFAKKKKKLPAWQVAMHALEQLKADPSTSSGQSFSVARSEQFYVGLTALLKTYISERDATDLRSSTDQQIIGYLEDLALSDVQKEQLTRIFGAGQMIKFANQDAVQQQMQDDWHHAFDFVKATKEQEQQKVKG